MEAPTRRHRVVTFVGVGLGLLLLVPAVALPIISPVFALPAPTGRYPVGTQYLYLVDQARPDAYAGEPGRYREVSVQMWYPSQPAADAETIPYMRREAGRALNRLQGIPTFLLDHHALVDTHAYLNAELARSGGPFPVVTYSASGLMSSHMTLFEELASHGYVVLCIGHPYWNPFLFGPGGEIRPFDDDNPYYRSWWAEADSAAVGQAKTQITQARTIAVQERAHQRHNALRPVAIDDLRLWAGDIGFVLDELAVMNQGDGLLAGALDLDRVGVMGFSKGGAAAGQFCVSDDRCQAGINWTGFMYGDIVTDNLDTPFLFVSEEETWCPNCFVNDLFYQRAEEDAYLMKIRGARHGSFGDLMLWGRLIQMGASAAEIETERMIEIQNVYALAFFEKHLRGMPSPLLDGPADDYPELIFSARIETP